ncbi:MAG: CRISPR-associated RAMP protein Csx10 [Cyanobacteria bacterium J06634_5]
MKRIELTITAQAPLAIGQRKPGGSVSEAMDYIPGTVIRGAIAGKILQQARAAGQITAAQPDLTQTDNDFRKLFLGDVVIFQNAYPAIAKLGDDEYLLSPCNTKVLPATALSSKTDSGFKKSLDDENRGVFDSLIDSFCAREHGLFYEPNSKEGDRVEPFGGFYSFYSDETEKLFTRYVSHSISKRLLTRVGINRKRATAQDDILYSLEVMNESQGKATKHPTVYKSNLLIKDDTLAAELCTFISQNCDRFRLGGSASRGLGKVKLNAALVDIPDLEDAKQAETVIVECKQRVEAFNKCLKERWEKWGLFGTSDYPIKEKTLFSIGLASEAILVDNWRRTFALSTDLLLQLTGVTNSDIKLEMAYSSYGYRSGWNAAWGLAKNVELVTKMGGVFLFSVPTAEEASWFEKLAKLEVNGIGERTSEGFGQIYICDEFHQVFREQPV